MRYRWHPTDGILDEKGNQVVQLVGGTKKFRNMAGRELAYALNVIEQEKEADRRRALVASRSTGTGDW